jgi:hypothetical protein
VLVKFDHRQLALHEATEVFQTLPAQWQLASLHPRMVQVDAEKDPLLCPVHWCFQVDDYCFIHSFQLANNPGLAVRDIQSAYGYGGPLSNTSAPEFLKAAQIAFVGWARENNVIAEFLRFHPLVPHANWYSGEVVSNRETVHIDLTKGLFEQYQARRRTDVRRFMESNVKVDRVPPQTMRDVFPELYKQNMDQIVASKDYYFSDRYFDALFRFGGTECWLAYSDNEVVAGAVILVSAQAKVAEYFLGAKTPGSDRHRAMIGLLHLAALHYQSLSFRYFYLGGGRSANPTDSLLFFKKGFSSLTGEYQIGTRVFDPISYARLKAALPKKAETGRILFYKD